MMRSLSGAMEPPSPVISVVIPWKIFEGKCGFTRMVISDCPSMSMNPGATTMPWASMVCLAAATGSLPIATIRPLRIPMSPEYQGDPVPSMMWPFLMRTSKEEVWLNAGTQSKTTSAKVRNCESAKLIWISDLCDSLWFKVFQRLNHRGHREHRGNQHLNVISHFRTHRENPQGGWV